MKSLSLITLSSLSFSRNHDFWFFKRLHNSFDLFSWFSIVLIKFSIHSLFIALNWLLTSSIDELSPKLIKRRKRFETLSFWIHCLNRTDLNSCERHSIYTKSRKLSQNFYCCYFKVNGIIYFLRLCHSFDMLHCSLQYSLNCKAIHEHPLRRLVCGDEKNC